MITFMRFAISLLAILLPLCAQTPQEPPKKGGGGPPKNLKLLTVDDLKAGTMLKFAQALGVKCDHCHIKGDNASDENPKKNVARMMITMVRDINGRFPDSKEHVTCYTCHRGQVTPDMAPAPAAPAQ